LCDKIVEVWLPPERPPRERWLTRSEAARLIWSAWRYREVQLGNKTERRSRQHVARFILVALYTGTRASAVCGAALQSTIVFGWTWTGEFSPAARRDAMRQRNDNRPYPFPANFSLICGAGKSVASGSLSSGTANRCRAWTRRSPMLSLTRGSATR